MTKEKQVTIKMDARTAAAVRQVLFDAQKGYTYDEVSVPPRVYRDWETDRKSTRLNSSHRL